LLSYYEISTIASEDGLQNAEAALLIHISSDYLKNKQQQSKGSYSKAVAVFHNINSVKSLVLENVALEKSSPLIYPPYFYLNENWDTLKKYTFLSKLDWAVNYNSVENHNFEDSFLAKLSPMSLSCEDTLNFETGADLTWSSENADTNSKLLLSFRWMPSYLDSKSTIYLPGFQIEDTGSFKLSPQILSQLNVPNYGVLYTVLTRYSIKPNISNGKKFVLISVSDLGITTFLKK